MIDPQIKLVVIVGPTASGKTDLAIRLAKQFDGEIVCADSRTIYRGMDIGTAKPLAEERSAVPHHLVDVVDPGERLSAAAFKTLAESAISDIWQRGKVPFMVGGSGLYVDAVLFDYEFPSEADPVLRATLELMSDDELREMLAAEDPEAFVRVDLANRRRVIRALETVGERGHKSSEVRPGTLVLGLSMNKEIAQKRIVQRIENMLGQGFIHEVTMVGEQYGWDSYAFDVIGYKAFKHVAREGDGLELAKADFARGDLSLFKRQVTWFKRNPAIRWLDAVGGSEMLEDAEELVRGFLR